MRFALPALIVATVALLAGAAPGCGGSASGAGGLDASLPLDSATAASDAAASGIDAPTSVDAPFPLDVTTRSDAPIDARPNPDGQATVDAAPSIDAPPTIDSAPPIDVPVDRDGTQAIDAPTTGNACGGHTGFTCAPTAYCDWSDDSCGAADTSGTCTARPDVCPAVVMRVCGCDGTVYQNACVAAAAGSDVNTAGGCVAPAGTFSCGGTYCDQGTEYCQKTEGGAFGAPPQFACALVPAGCSPPSCGCLATHACGNLCSTDDAGDVTLTCLAPGPG